MAKDHNCEEELREIGSKVTPGRLAILALLEREENPLTVEEIKRKLRTLNQVTLYRVLELFAKAGLVHKGMSEGVARFEYAKKMHHHHLVCADCGFSKICNAC